MTCTGAVESAAATIEEVITEIAAISLNTGSSSARGM